MVGGWAGRRRAMQMVRGTHTHTTLDFALAPAARHWRSPKHLKPAHRGETHVCARLRAHRPPPRLAPTTPSTNSTSDVPTTHRDHIIHACMCRPQCVVPGHTHVPARCAGRIFIMQILPYRHDLLFAVGYRTHCLQHQHIAPRTGHPHLGTAWQ